MHLLYPGQIQISTVFLRSVVYTQNCKKDHTRQSQGSSSSTTMANTVVVPHALTNTGATTSRPFTSSESVTAAVQASAETPSTQEAKTSY
jgi:hypothetical protein